MCGIVGYIQTKRQSIEWDNKYRKALIDLLYMDSLRGLDSTGVACIPKDKTQQSFVLKKAVPGYCFVELDEYKRILAAQMRPGIFIGHNRAATRGAVSDENAHPFHVDHIYLVHNGSIHNQWSLESGTQSAVDSCHIAHAIAKHGADKVLPKIDGAAILLWHDAKENSMNIARTKDREIRWIFDVNGTCWFASEKEMLVSALKRNAISMSGNFVTIGEYTHIKWMLSSEDSCESLGTFTKNTFPEYVPPWKNNPHYYEWNKDKEGSNMGKESSSTDHTVTGWPATTTGKSSYIDTANSLKPKEVTSKRKIAQVDKKLEPFALKVGDEITVTRVQWQANKNDPSFGNIICVWNGLPKKAAIKVIIPDVHKYSYERATNQYRVIVYNIVQEIMPKLGRHQPVLYTKLKPLGFKDMVQGPGGYLITRDEFKAKAINGCPICKQQVWAGDHERTEWYNGLPLCLACSTELSDTGEALRK